MLFTLIFAGLALLLVAVVLIRRAHPREGAGSPAPPRGTTGASRTPSGSSARRERSRRRAQSRRDRRKRH